jgi:MOSC domain-containing protein YiiM
VVSVNVGAVHTVVWRDRSVTTAIWKHPVDGRVPLQGVNLEGDDQADRRVHGGTDKAVYAYAVEDYDWWSATTGHLAAGTFGENLTTRGLDLAACRIGDRWRVGSTVLEVAQPRQPCFKLGIRMGDDDFPGRFAEAGRPGVYLRIVTPGDVGAGDEIGVLAAEDPAVAIGALVTDPIDEGVLRLVAADPRVPEGWRRTAARALAR